MNTTVLFSRFSCSFCKAVFFTLGCAGPVAVSVIAGRSAGTVVVSGCGGCTGSCGAVVCSMGTCTIPVITGGMLAL